MSTDSKLARHLKWAHGALKFASLRPVKAIAALCALLLQYGCATAQQYVLVPALYPEMHQPVAQPDLAIICHRDPSRPGCERLGIPPAARPVAGAALAEWRSSDPFCARDPSRPGCDAPPQHYAQWHPGQPQEQASPATVAAAIAVTVLAVGIGHGIGGKAFKFTPSMFMRK